MGFFFSGFFRANQSIAFLFLNKINTHTLARDEFPRHLLGAKTFLNGAFHL